MSAKDKKQENRRREHARLQASFQNSHDKGGYVKRMLRARGVNLPFYDFYDSYFEEFAKITAQAKQQFPSLLGIFEVEDAVYFNEDRSSLAPGLKQIFWSTKSEQKGYGTHNGSSNINGHTSAFHDQDGAVKTLVVIRRIVPNSSPHREVKYVLKMVALMHELGHVRDLEAEINFHHAAGTCDLIEAEVFAHLYAIQRMAEKNYRQCFNMLVDALKKNVKTDSYLGEVARLTLDRMPDYKLIDVNEFVPKTLTPEDLKVLGADGRKALGIRNAGRPA